MYEVNKYLFNAQHIYVRNSMIDLNQPKEMIDKSKLRIHTGYGDTVYNPNEPYKDEYDNGYSNVDVYGLPNGKLTILQDYGNGQFDFDNFEMISYQILFGGIYEPSLGYYDGHLCYIVCDGKDLQIYKICKHDPIDITKLYDKRPFSCAFGFDTNDDDINKPLKFAYHISYRENVSNCKSEHKIVDLMENIPYSKVISTKSFNLAMTAIDYNAIRDISSKEYLNYITDELLVSLGFSYDANSENWTLGDVIIKEEAFDYLNRFYHLLKDENDKEGKIIYTADEIPIGTEDFKNKLKKYKMER